MSKFKALSQIARKLSKSRYVRNTALGAGAGTVTAIAIAPGHAMTHEGKQGLVIGAGVGFASLVVPRVLRTKAARGVLRAANKEFKRQAKTRGKVVFRRIKGRIIPIRKK
jgi:hypothetical protein